MMHKPCSMIHVSYVGQAEPVILGRLALKDRMIFFEYDVNFLKTGFELSPFKLPLKAGVLACKDTVFDGLFGAFNDSLPDGWGRLLLDRKLKHIGLNPDILSPLDRLCYVGHHGVGALVFDPEVSDNRQSVSDDLDKIAYEVIQIQETDGDLYIEELLQMNGSSAGARPKVFIKYGEDEWLVKFASPNDPSDIGAIEYAYHLMAKAAGLDVPEAKLFHSKQCPGYFGVKRFDRVKQKRLHMHSISGLLHVDHRIPNLDYQTVIKATAWLTKSDNEVEKQFRAAAFNVLTHNRDDHAKNFSYMMDENGVWTVSKAYDLTFSAGPAGEHCTTIMGEGLHPSESHLSALASVGGIKKKRAQIIINDVKSATSQWACFAHDAGVSQASYHRICEKLAKHTV